MEGVARLTFALRKCRVEKVRRHASRHFFPFPPHHALAQGTMRLFLIRHGETVDNVAQV